MQYRIRNWERWQSYRKDRGAPPWIKLYKALLHDENWTSLTDAQRGQLACLWLVASSNSGLLRADIPVLQRICCMDTALDMQVLISAGFVEVVGSVTSNVRQHDNQMTSSWRQRDAPETETETEIETETPLAPQGGDARACDSSFAAIPSCEKKTRTMTRPTRADVAAYIAENHYTVDADAWLAHYESNGWRVGKAQMRDWKAAVRTWAIRNRQNCAMGGRHTTTTRSMVNQNIAEAARDAVDDFPGIVEVRNDA